ncbi:MAG: polyprenyl synthetase family protein, partial [Micrococcaceae bacterium]|nr:polyprenyl synthetase family protein [Micrococcaceae bacterium]MDN5905167.1 polyprenyl synthetase family protein [Micrococcaceae bacterium]
RPPRAEDTEFIKRLDSMLATFLSEQRDIVTGISPTAVDLVDSVETLIQGGKRLRPRFAWWGYAGAGGDPADEAIIRAAAALELFQAAALIHDDVIDRSATRRGRPSVHKSFESTHSRLGWARDGARFGEAAALLAGDLCLSFSEQLFATATDAGSPARRIFDGMRTQVMAGQYLDVLEESAGPSSSDSDVLERARTILRYKSAKYSTENPLLLGGALAGADDHLLAGYSAFALPIGEAFQLRDDVLGVFGNAEITGKPAGDDLREGKRTEMIAHGLLLASEEDRDFIQNRLGADDLTAAEINRMMTVLTDCGALAATEGSIAALSAQAFDALDVLSVTDQIREQLRALGKAVTERTA